MTNEELNLLVATLTLEEKASLCSGRDNWNTEAIERLGVPSCRTSDGPHGLRTQDGSINSLSEEDSVAAVCFPAGCATASSFDKELIGRMGEELGRECQALGVNVLLGPGINMKRSPLCGRNFEYFSEDPLVAGELGASFVQGLQSQGVGACVKHFFANSQEFRRMDSSSEMDERTMREIYLPAFEQVVKKAQPWSLMAAYNKIDGVYATANKKYLTDVLRNEWGFDGLVMSDWGAVHDRSAVVAAGCDVTMPAEDTDDEIVKAVQNGKLSEATLDACCKRVISLALTGHAGHKDGAVFDFESGHTLAREIASESIVLLKNDRSILPLDKAQTVAFIGGFAAAPRYQGGGSSHINSFKVVSALEAAQKAGLAVSYAQGYNNKDGTTDEALLSQAVAVAKNCDTVVLFIGLPDMMESEGVDRQHLKLPDGHNRLLQEVTAVQPNVVVVLHNGSPIEMPWVASVPAIVEAYLGGQAVGEAVVDVLWGSVNPSGHLAESFPKKLEDNPSYLFYSGEGGIVQYSERMFIGYRYYASKHMDVLFPFGHGLSYTTFAFDNLSLSQTEMDENDTITASVTITNTGTRKGKALAQLYVMPPKVDVIRPLRELKGFEKLELEPNESKVVSFVLGKRAFAHWNANLHDWCVEGGSYTIQIGENAHTVLCEKDMTITAKDVIHVQEYSDATPMSEVAKHPIGRKFIDDNIGQMIMGMVAAGFIPKTAVEAFQLNDSSKLNMDMIEKIAEHSGATAGGASGIGVLMSQSIGILKNFIAPERAAELKALLTQLNGRA